MNTPTPTIATNQALPAPACAGTADRQADPLRCPSYAVSRARQENRKKQQHVMATGPHLDADGHTLIIPSKWYDKAAVTFWSQHGFHYNNRASTWERDTRQPLTGKIYSAEVWLESTCRQFYQFWPTLLHKCERCGEPFARTNRYQTHCNECETKRQEAHDRHFSY